MTMKVLILDTCAIVKFFINECGSETVRYIVDNRAKLGLRLRYLQGLNLRNSYGKKSHTIMSVNQKRKASLRAPIHISVLYFIFVTHIQFLNLK